ncbi:ParB/RepB/Spo0J family partition protein [Waddlia chondrophila]|uniref:Putative chromosome-partitioning protein parB n=1 Tax=Waddlia chondrophila (strain ATCC VR-1470 / WSU 86-1044) TaxID=716544 RepID=D6YSK9_WADCW|nr:ParB/RepB/Spo0J family partition protein [Waddlia chondrophila]ADI39055.1 putative chromosome-partitioning protein parB [Waddlia chondrophila WSU 86-1044]
MSQEVVEVELSQIRENPYQPRKQFNREELEELAQSIQSVGVLQPPVVRKMENGGYELIAGERRFRAAEIAGLTTIHVLVSQKPGNVSAEAALIENIQRVDLNPLDIAQALRRLIVEFGLQQDELADKVGKKRSTVTNYLRLLSLPHKIQESLQFGEISMGHAKAILSVSGFEEQLYLHRMVVEDGLSVRETEEAAAKLNVKPVKKKMRTLNENTVYLSDLEEKLQQRLGTKVTIASSGKRGKILIDYYSLDDLERILEVISL